MASLAEAFASQEAVPIKPYQDLLNGEDIQLEAEVIVPNELVPGCDKCVLSKKDGELSGCCTGVDIPFPALPASIDASTMSQMHENSIRHSIHGALYMNCERQVRGLPPMKFSLALSNVAATQAWSKKQEQGKGGHVGFGDRLKVLSDTYGYGGVSEGGFGFHQSETSRFAVSGSGSLGLMADGHRGAIINPEANRCVGIGIIPRDPSTPGNTGGPGRDFVALYAPCVSQ